MLVTVLMVVEVVVVVGGGGGGGGGKYYFGDNCIYNIASVQPPIKAENGLSVNISFPTFLLEG